MKVKRTTNNHSQITTRQKHIGNYINPDDVKEGKTGEGKITWIGMPQKIEQEGARRAWRKFKGCDEHRAKQMASRGIEVNRGHRKVQRSGG